jgi:hypothetical protein
VSDDPSFHSTLISLTLSSAEELEPFSFVEMPLVQRSVLNEENEEEESPLDLALMSLSWSMYLTLSTYLISNPASTTSIL